MNSVSSTGLDDVSRYVARLNRDSRLLRDDRSLVERRSSLESRGRERERAVDSHLQPARLQVTDLLQHLLQGLVGPRLGWGD